MKRLAPILLSLVFAACAGDATATYELAPQDASGVTGVVTLSQTPGKSGLGELRWSFDADDPSGRELVGYVHVGRCEMLGNAVHPNALEDGAFSSQLHVGGTGRPVGGQTIEAYRDEYAFAVHDAVDEVAPTTTVVACVDL